jgi:hypothetical protein
VTCTCPLLSIRGGGAVSINVRGSSLGFTPLAFKIGCNRKDLGISREYGVQVDETTSRRTEAK